jgi:hypothetical protein
MKIRNGFVSNSSSSSFICDVSGHVESGWDISLDDAGMYECVNGHTFLDEYKVDSDDDYKSNYDVPAHKCPICTMTEFNDSEMLSYLITRSCKTREQIEEEIRQETGSNYDNYRKFKCE